MAEEEQKERTSNKDTDQIIRRLRTSDLEQAQYATAMARLGT